MSRPRPTRSDYVHFQTLATRWRDNDVYGHMNNAVYYEYIDTVVNAWIIDSGALPVPDGPVVGLVAETGCRFHASLGFPDDVTAGLRVARIGRTSVTYEVGLFCNDTHEAAADAHFVHVYVDKATTRPIPLPDGFRAALSSLQARITAQE